MDLLPIEGLATEMITGLEAGKGSGGCLGRMVLGQDALKPGHDQAFYRSSPPDSGNLGLLEEVIGQVDRRPHGYIEA